MAFKLAAPAILALMGADSLRAIRVGDTIHRSDEEPRAENPSRERVVGFSAADEIEKLDRLKKAGSITDAEFARLRAKLVQ